MALLCVIINTVNGIIFARRKGVKVMVYSIRSNKPIVSSKPLETKRQQSSFSQKVDAFSRDYHVSVQTDTSGKVSVKAIKNE